MSVGQAQREISSSEFTEWVVFDSIEPGEPHRSDLRAAMQACVVANAHNTKKGRNYKLEDFLLKFDVIKENKKKKRTPQKELRLKLETWKSMGNVTDLIKVEKKKDRKKKNGS